MFAKPQNGTCPHYIRDGKVFVTGLAADAKRLDLAKQLGFTTINTQERPAVEVILEMTSGLGVDVVLDATSGGAVDEAISLLKLVGQLVITAKVGGPVTFPGRELLKREVIINTQRAGMPSAFRRAISVLAAEHIDVKPLLTHRMKLEDADSGFQKLIRREAMKVVLVV